MRLGGAARGARDCHGGGWSRQIDLTLGMPVNVADGALTLVAASPVRRVDAQPAKGSAYRFTFAFRGGR